MHIGYLDPGPGSFIPLALVGGVVGVFVGIVITTRSLKAKVGGALRRRPDTDA